MGDTVPGCGVDNFMISGLHHENPLTDVGMRAILTKQPESCTYAGVSSVEDGFQARAVDGPRGSWRARHGKRHGVSPR
jgi:hypothetical protein